MTDSVRPARKKTGKRAAEAAFSFDDFSFDDLAPQTPRSGRKKAVRPPTAKQTTAKRAAAKQTTAKRAATSQTGKAGTGPSKSDLIGVGVLLLVIAGAVALHWAVNTFHPLEHRTHASLRLTLPSQPLRLAV